MRDGCTPRRRPGHWPERGDERGFALLIVLWTMALLALLAAQVTGAGRAETRLAAAQRQGAQLQAAADAAVYEMVFHMLPGSGDYWVPGAMERDLREAGGLVHLSVTDERGKFDINQAAPAQMAALFEVLGTDRTSATALGQAIADWRTNGPNGDSDQEVPPAYKAAGYAWGPPGQDFESVPELQLVLGMTPALYKAALPYLTIDTEQGPWAAYAAPVVLAALAKAQQEGSANADTPDARGPVVLKLTASVHGPGGAAFTRRATVRFDGALSGGDAKYRFLAWESGAG